MYRFKIYRNKVGLSSSQNTVDFDRYNNDNYAFERTINPIWSGLGLKDERGERMFFRRHLEGVFTLIDDDFAWVNGIRTSSTESNKYRLLKIEELVDDVWTEQWVGFFSVIVGKFDLNNCKAEFSELLTFDKYSIILENIEREKDFFSVSPSANNVHYFYEEYSSDKYTLTVNGSVTAASLPPVAPTLAEMLIDDKYTLYSKSLVVTNVSDAVCSYTITYDYRRNFINQVDDPSVGGDPSMDWEKDPVTELPGTNGVFHWVRYFDGYSETSYPVYNYSSVPGKYYYYGGYYVQQYTYLITRVWSAESANERSREFGAVLNLLLLDLLGTLKVFNWSSQFLMNATNPITEAANELNRIRVFQMTDVRDTTDRATRAVISFKIIESFLDYLNCGWYIDDNDVFVIEHKKFFDNGLSYTTETVGFDITADAKTKKEALKTKEFSYKNIALPRVEEFSFFVNTGWDYIGEPIIYRGNMANWGEENTSSESFEFATDLQAAIMETGTTDGFIFVAVDAPTLDGEEWVTRSTGVLSNSDIWNSPLCIANVHDNYWKWGRPVLQGFMNGVYTVFDSVDYNFAQEEFEVSSCNAFNPYLLVRTDYGNGHVDNSVLSLKDKKRSLSLSY